MDAYHTVYRGGLGEIVEKKSRFIAEDWDARHHCWAYVLGRNPSAERMSDDGEPAGTAGKPILEVIRGRQITDVLVIVTRYFGGTLLGTGGLVRAYTASAAEGLKHSEIITRFHGFKLRIAADYTSLGKIQYLLAQRKICILESVYTDKVELIVLVPDEEEGALFKEIMDGTNGQAVLEKEQECWFAQTENGIQIWNE